MGHHTYNHHSHQSHHSGGTAALLLGCLFGCCLANESSFVSAREQELAEDKQKQETIDQLNQEYFSKLKADIDLFYATSRAPEACKEELKKGFDKLHDDLKADVDAQINEGYSKDSLLKDYEIKWIEHSRKLLKVLNESKDSDEQENAVKEFQSQSHLSKKQKAKNFLATIGSIATSAMSIIVSTAVISAATTVVGYFIAEVPGAIALALLGLIGGAYLGACAGKDIRRNVFKIKDHMIGNFLIFHPDKHAQTAQRVGKIAKSVVSAIHNPQEIMEVPTFTKASFK